MEVIRDLNESNFGRVKGSNSLSGFKTEWEQRKKTENSLGEFTVKGSREMRQYLEEDVESREFFPFSGGRLQSLCV